MNKKLINIINTGIIKLPNQLFNQYSTWNVDDEITVRS